VLKLKNQKTILKNHLISGLVVFTVLIGSLAVFGQIAKAQGQPSMISPPLHNLGNSAYIMDNEKEIATARWDTINAENEEIFQGYLGWDTQKIGYADFAALYNSGKTKKIKRGRVMIDGWGQGSLPDPNIAASYNLATLKALLKYGVEVRFYNPTTTMSALLTPGKSMGRMHFKVTWLKGQNIVESGDPNNLSINFRADHHLGKRGVGYRSTETMMQGPVYLDVQEYIEDAWAHGTAPDLSSVTDDELANAERNLERYFKAAKAIREKNPAIDWASKLKPIESIKFIHDTVEQKGILFPLHDRFQSFIDSSEKTEGPLYLISPYIDLPTPLFEAIKRARQRGVEVTVITTSMQSSDMKMSSYVFVPQAENLQALGVKVYIHDNKDLLHIKMVKQGNTVFSGLSDNLNNRSKETDIEGGYEFTDPKYAADADQIINTLITKETKPFDSSTLTTGTMCLVRVWQAFSQVPFIHNQL